MFYFDDSDGADSIHFELMDHVAAYCRKQLLRDRSHYLRPMYRRQLFSDYYHTKYGVVDDRQVLAEYRIVALKRSGNHAIIKWIGRHLREKGSTS